MMLFHRVFQSPRPPDTVNTDEAVGSSGMRVTRS
jgi:hypothetical protein